MAKVPVKEVGPVVPKPKDPDPEKWPKAKALVEKIKEWFVAFPEGPIVKPKEPIPVDPPIDPPVVDK